MLFCLPPPEMARSPAELHEAVTRRFTPARECEALDPKKPRSRAPVYPRPLGRDMNPRRDCWAMNGLLPPERARLVLKTNALYRTWFIPALRTRHRLQQRTPDLGRFTPASEGETASNLCSSLMRTVYSRQRGRDWTASSIRWIKTGLPPPERARP